MHRNALTFCHARLSASRSAGFSLLEVIIATALLASSSILLLQLLSIGERHGTKGEERLLAQMLGQNVMEEIATGIRPLRSLEEEPLPGFPDWTASVSWIPTDLEGLVQVHVRIAKIPATPDGPLAVESLPNARPQESISQTASEPGPHRSSFELTRWLRAKEASEEAQDTGPDSNQPGPESATLQPRAPQRADTKSARRRSNPTHSSATLRRLRRESGGRVTP